MSLALKWGGQDGDQATFVYFDAVTSYKTQYKGKVTEHPIDSGATIADHFVKVNPRIIIQGVITGADISVGNENIEDEEGNTPINTKPAPDAVTVDASSSINNSLLPESIGQLFSPQEPTITFSGAQNTDLTEQVKTQMVDLISGEKYNEISKTYTNSMQVLQLYEYEGSLIRSIKNDMVMVGLDFLEDADSGDALYLEVVLEQVDFSVGRSDTLPPDVVDALINKASPLSNNGKQDSTVNDLGDTGNDATALKKLALKAAGV